MSQLFHHILSRDPVVISCDLDLSKYYIAGEEVTQDEIISALADAFDNDQTRNDIQDDLYFAKAEMELDGMKERDMQKAFVAMSTPDKQLQYFNY